MTEIPFSDDEIRQAARRAIEAEIEALRGVLSQVDDAYPRAVRLIINSRGRVIVTGIGKSANIAAKIVATLNSTGTPALFMHAADAIHGDLGMIQPADVVVCVSKSGDTPEIKVLVPLIKRFGNPLVAIVSNRGSLLAREADIILGAHVEAEACPNNLAPTSSTTAQLVAGDALAVCLLRSRGFTSDDFARYHPGGALGKKLYMRVEDLFRGNAAPQVPPEAALNEVILEISSKRLGATAVVGARGELLGIVTDGDLRRLLQSGRDLARVRAADIMTPTPKTAQADEMAVNAFHRMQDHSITQLAVVDGGKYLGIIHMHDILREGIA